MRFVVRVAVAGALVVLVAGLVLAGARPAAGLPIGRQFAPVGSPTWPVTVGGGPEESTPVTVDTAELAPGADLPDSDQLTATQDYLYVSLYPNYVFAGSFEPFAMPQVAATLTTSSGTVTGQSPPPNLGIDAQWYFPVPADISSATLQVAGFTKVLGNERGDFLPWTFSPSSIDLVATSPLPQTTPSSTSTPTGTGHAHITNRAKRPAAVATAGGTPLAATLGAGAAGVAVVGAGAAGVVSLFRRRAFYRADREGRFTLSGPPLLVAGATLSTGVVPPGHRAILVKLLGALQIEGAKGKDIAGPVLEIIVFLALNPGRTFTSVQLRESIWGLGRQPITSNTFRVYMVQLRKAFGTGVVITERFRYEMTDVVTSDWDQFRALLQADDELTRREDALALVRGPVLHGAFDGKKNSPFAWAIDTVHHIEDEVTSVATELALACLEAGDPARASRAVTRGLLCMESNLRLRTVDLEVGAAAGGPGEVGRRLDAARASMGTFPHDVAELERAARQLGWVAPMSG